MGTRQQKPHAPVTAGQITQLVRHNMRVLYVPTGTDTEVECLTGTGVKLSYWQWIGDYTQWTDYSANGSFARHNFAMIAMTGRGVADRLSVLVDKKVQEKINKDLGDNAALTLFTSGKLFVAYSGTIHTPPTGRLHSAKRSVSDMRILYVNTTSTSTEVKCLS